MGAAIDLRRRPVQTVVGSAGLVTVVFFVWLLSGAETDSGPWRALLDAGVGVAFVVAGALARGPSVQRLLFVGVGVSWLLGSLPPARGVHHGILAVALLAFPTGRLRGTISWTIVVAAAFAALGWLSQLELAALFAAVGVRASVQRHRLHVAGRYVPLAAGALAGLFGVAGSIARWWPHAYSARVTLIVYELVLLLVALGFPAAAWRVIRARTTAVHRPLLATELQGIEGLAEVLGRVLGDPELRIDRWDAEAAQHVTEAAHDAVPHRGAPRRWLVVDGGGGPLAVVVYTTAALEDPATRGAVASAVRLAVRNLDLQVEQEAQLAALESARARLVDAADRSRERTMVELREHVEAPLERAAGELRAVQASELDAAAAPAVEIAVGELAGAAAEIEDLVAGVPPAGLGGGRLREVLMPLTQRAPVATSLTITDDAAGSVEVEEALFYVCSEALTNVVKHADATAVSITIRRDGDSLVATITDDGRGGADPAGTGLLGLADRLAARGGRLQVDSTPGAGTSVVASLPVSRPSATA
jgi:signal transduction histidine kinase